MKVLVCARKTNESRATRVIGQLLAASQHQVAILQQSEHTDDWQEKVETKLREADFVLFIVEAGTFDSEAIKWEYNKAKELNKRITGFKSKSTPRDVLLFCEGFQVFSDAHECFSYLVKTYGDDRQLLIEQYKLMVASTEKVTGQRLTVNNLFFTVTSSVISIAFLIGKTFEFSIVALVGMIAFTVLALLLTMFWSSMVTAYGLLNKGKFVLIDEIEKKLRTNLFEREWKILTGELKYRPNTETENSIVFWYRVFIMIILGLEILYWIWLIYEFASTPIPHAIAAPI